MRLLHGVSAGAILVAVQVLLVGCAATGVYHVVEPGQTFYRIAKTYGVEEAHLARVNNISNPGRIEVGQRLYIPGARVPLIVPSQPPGKERASSAAPATPGRTGKKASSAAPSTQPAPAAQAKPTDDSVIPGPPPVLGTFVWPVRGKLITEFGTIAGKSSKGVEIAVPHGTPVVAAAAGKVIYSNNMRGYGNLIILEHADNYFTVYGYNAKNLVAVNSFVDRGERIALSGTQANGKSPRLHFEIRKGKTAVNPIFYLP